jgi:hypothetical protein
MIGNPSYVPRYEEYETVHSPYSLGYYVDPQTVHTMRSWSTNSPLARTVAAPLHATAYMARTLIPYAILGNTAFKTYQDYKKDLQKAEAIRKAKEDEANRRTLSIEGKPSVPHVDEQGGIWPPFADRDEVLETVVVDDDKVPTVVDLSEEVVRKKPVKKQPARPRSRVDEMLYIPKFNIDVPGGKRLIRPGKLGLTDVAEGARFIYDQMLKRGYNAVMNDPVVKGAKAYRLFTEEGLREAILNPNVAIPEAVKGVMSEETRKAIAFPKLMKRISPPAGQYEWRGQADPAYQARATQKYEKEYRKREAPNLI